MAELYITIKWLHITAACVAFGSNVTHIFWLLSANRDPVHRANIIRLVKKIDDRLAVPAYAALIIAGAAMWWWQWPTNTSWIVASLIISMLLMIMGICSDPFMKKWIKMAREPEKHQPWLDIYAKRMTAWWTLIVSGVVIVLYLMIFKPTLW